MQICGRDERMLAAQVEQKNGMQRTTQNGVTPPLTKKAPYKPYARIGLVRICAGCALKARGIQSPEMEAAAKLRLASSRVPSLAWCPVTAIAKRRQGGLQAGTAVINGKIAPKSIVIGAADPIPQRGRRNRWPRHSEWSEMLPGFVPPACSQRDRREQGRSGRFRCKPVGPAKPMR